jgi:hypothetical protein
MGVPYSQRWRSRRVIEHTTATTARYEEVEDRPEERSAEVGLADFVGHQREQVEGGRICVKLLGRECSYSTFKQRGPTISERGATDGGRFPPSLVEIDAQLLAQAQGFSFHKWLGLRA